MQERGPVLRLTCALPQPPQLSLPVIQGLGTVTMALTGKPGAVYTVESFSDLVTWTALTTFTSAAAVTPISDSLLLSGAQRFYRAKTP